jgi:hypothetical protein
MKKKNDELRLGKNKLIIKYVIGLHIYIEVLKNVFQYVTWNFNARDQTPLQLFLSPLD